jgi:predicted  nucleic acid-binding Zn ribbon protein
MKPSVWASVIGDGNHRMTRGSAFIRANGSRSESCHARKNNRGVSNSLFKKTKSPVSDRHRILSGGFNHDQPSERLIHAITLRSVKLAT